MPNIAAGQADDPAFAAVALNAPCQGTNYKSLEDRPGGPVTTCRRATTAIP
jgi:hypothetical protein